MSIRRENINCEDPTDIGPAKDRIEARIWARYAADMGSGGESQKNRDLQREWTKEYFDEVNSGAFVRRNVLLNEMTRKWQEEFDEIEEAEHEWDEHVLEVSERISARLLTSKKTVSFSRRRPTERKIYMWASEKMVKGKRGPRRRTVPWEGAEGRTAEQAVELEYSEKLDAAPDVIKAANHEEIKRLESVLSYPVGQPAPSDMEFSGEF